MMYLFRNHTFIITNVQITPEVVFISLISIFVLVVLANFFRDTIGSIKIEKQNVRYVSRAVYQNPMHFI